MKKKFDGPGGHINFESGDIQRMLETIEHFHQILSPSSLKIMCPLSTVCGLDKDGYLWSSSLVIGAGYGYRSKKIALDNAKNVGKLFGYNTEDE